VERAMKKKSENLGFNLAVPLSLWNIEKSLCHSGPIFSSQRKRQGERHTKKERKKIMPIVTPL
jgi:hypothetical protein